MSLELVIAFAIVFITLVSVVFLSPTSKSPRKISSSAMAGFDEIFSPAAYSSRIELEEQSERVIARPAAEDKKH